MLQEPPLPSVKAFQYEFFLNCSVSIWLISYRNSNLLNFIISGNAETWKSVQSDLLHISCLITGNILTPADNAEHVCDFLNHASASDCAPHDLNDPREREQVHLVLDAAGQRFVAESAQIYYYFELQNFVNKTVARLFSALQQSSVPH